MIIMETTSYIKLYISQKVNHNLKTAHMSSKPENLLIYCDTHILIYVIVLLSQSLSLIMHKYWGLYTFFNVLQLIFAYRKSSITKVIVIENGKEQKRLYITSHCALLQFFGSCTKASSCRTERFH